MNVGKILGQEYRLRGAEDPAHREAVAAYLEGREPDEATLKPWSSPIASSR